VTNKGNLITLTQGLNNPYYPTNLTKVLLDT